MTKDKEKKIDDNQSESWTDNIKLESLQNALNQDIIYPTFKPRINTVYLIKALSEPRQVNYRESNFYVLDIERDGMRFQMNLNNSFLFQLALLLQRENLLSKDIENRIFLISKDDKGYFSIQSKK